MKGTRDKSWFGVAVQVLEGEAKGGGGGAHGCRVLSVCVCMYVLVHGGLKIPVRDRIFLAILRTYGVAVLRDCALISVILVCGVGTRDISAPGS